MSRSPLSAAGSTATTAPHNNHGRIQTSRRNTANFVVNKGIAKFNFFVEHMAAQVR
jgi:hypothetical protein